ncbi:uncharacterized protein LOC141630378 [Silene latifolia]|uniref:uncharacterized protein LOC141630378 n=1 Tax=Silene latifolia TaxID=37657 RepID=UPI003D7713E1
MATRANIASRVRGEISPFSFCHFYCETSVHLFKDCAFAKRVWEGLGIRDEEDDNGGGIRDWIEAKWREFGGREQALLMVGCWAIWEHRNRVVFEDTLVSREMVMRRVTDVMDEIDGGGFGQPVQRAGRGRGVVRERVEGWRVPPDGSVKINVDAGVKEGEGVSLGVVCRDANGRVLWGLSCAQEHCWEPQVAEAVAILEGVREALARGHSMVILESDCLQVIEALKRKAKGRSILSLVIADILDFSNSFILWFGRILVV